MRSKTSIRLASVAAGLACAAMLYGFSGGPSPGLTGAPGEATCTQCHGGGAPNTGGGSVTLNLLNYRPGEKQRVVLTVNDPNARRWGFQASTRLTSNNSQAGTLEAADNRTQVQTAGGVQYIMHTIAGTRSGASGPVTFEFDWTAPSGSDEVTLYVAANAANNSGAPDTGDDIYTAAFKLPAAAAASGPRFAESNAVLNGASFVAGIAPGAWISLFGADLAPATRTWRNDEIREGQLPEELDGVSVEVNNVHAAVHFISPTQLNVQVPDLDASGPVEVKVTTPQGTVSTTANLQPVAPGLFMYDPENRKYVAAQHADFSIVGRAGLFQGAISTPARPGEVIILYGTGFGPTSPATPSGRVVTQPAEIDRSRLNIRIGDQPAEVQFAGITIAGVWQFNVKVPDNLPDGDAAVIAEIGGIRTQDNAFLTVQR